MKKPDSSEAQLGIVYKNVQQLKPYLKNARTHSKAQITLIVNSIKEFGFNNPLLLDGANGVIAGHGRLAAAVKLSLTTVPCIELKHLSGAAKKAYILADNQIAQRSGWDDAMLKEELAVLEVEGIDKNLLGFADTELKALGKQVSFTAKDKPQQEPDRCPHCNGVLPSDS